MLGGCAKPRNPSPMVELQPGRYEPAFAAAKQVLIDARFDLDRVDARAGVITTTAKPTSGLATPWDGEQSSLGQEVEDLLNRQFRRVRITFEPQAAEAATAPTPPHQDAAVPDMRLQAGALLCTISVSVERLRRPGWRLETSSVRQSSFYYDPEWGNRAIWPQYTVPFAQDHRLATRLAGRIRRSLEQQTPP